MMINFSQEVQHDTITVKNTAIQDSVSLKSDSGSTIRPLQLKDTIHHKLLSVPAKPAFIITDTISVCCSNIIADITFYDSVNAVTGIKWGNNDRFPFIFIEKNKIMHDEARAILIRQLKPGFKIPLQPLHNDWIIFIILVAAYLYAFVRTLSKNTLSSVTRFFLFRGINEAPSREIGGLFNWQSTILNLISFLILGLFGYFAASYYSVIPPSITGIAFWLISFAVIISAITLRHIVCIITGRASGERELFREYLLGIYQSYRFSALVLFVIIILMSYTNISPLRFYFITGIIALAIMYLFRITRLIIIFINRNISIFYLILYLCALEILPVVISVKYISGLV